MKTYLVSYDLDKPGQDYSDLIAAIRRLGGIQTGSQVSKVLYSEWLVKTDLTSSQIYDALAPYIDSNDMLLVVGLTGEATWNRLMTDNDTVKQILAA